MPSVADELEALRKSRITKSHASKLRTAGGLSTPEQEAAALKAKADKEKSYSKEAIEHIKVTGAKELDKEQAFLAHQRVAKRSDAEKKQEATKTLQEFNTAKLKGETAENGITVKIASPKAVKKSTAPFPAVQPTVSTPDHVKPIETKSSPSPPPPPPPVVTAPSATAQPDPDSAEPNAAEPTEPKAAPAPIVAAPPAKTDPAQSDPDTQAKAAAAAAPPTASAPADTPTTEVDTVETAPENADTTTAVNDNNADDILDIPTVTATEQPQQQVATEPPKQNRAEKKARKMMHRWNMRPVKDVTRVSIKINGARGGTYVINQPDVYQATGVGKDTYVVFGEARNAGRDSYMQQFQRQAAAAQTHFAESNEKQAPQIPSVQRVPEPPETAETDTVDESGVDSKDIELVMSQASCSRKQAVAALRDNENDVVNAIMSLT